MADTSKQTVTKTLVVVIEVPLFEREGIEEDWRLSEKDELRLDQFLYVWKDRVVEVRLK